MARSASPDLLPVLRSQTQADVLTRMLLGPPESMTVQEVASAVGADQWSVRRELQRLERSGIVEVRAVGRSKQFRIADASPLVEPLRLLIERSIGAEQLIADAVGGLEGLEALVLYGSWARGAIGAASDVDLLVVGDVPYAELVDRLAEVEQRIGREIDLVVMTAGELAARRADGSGFLRDVLERPHRVLRGALP